jgi:L-lactate utilization protein LutC
MSSARDAFLARVRQAVAEGNRAGQAADVLPRGSTGYQGAGPDPVEHFCSALTAAGGQAHPVPDAKAAAARVIELLREKGCRRVLVGRGDGLDALDLPGRLRALGLEVAMTDALPADRKEVLFAADAGVSGVYALIAETGTVVAVAGPAEPRSLSLLPPLHIAVAGRAQLLPDLFDLFDLLGTPPQLPSCLTLITGPSKTGDIELRLVTGVHGPGEVHVVLVTGEWPGAARVHNLPP